MIFLFFRHFFAFETIPKLVFWEFDGFLIRPWFNLW